MAYKTIVARDMLGNPSFPGEAWLDSENSILCAYCAVESDNEDEVPQFRPVTPVYEFAEDECCDQCSELLLEME